MGITGCLILKNDGFNEIFLGVGGLSMAHSTKSTRESIDWPFIRTIALSTSCIEIEIKFESHVIGKVVYNLFWCVLEYWDSGW